MKTADKRFKLPGIVSRTALQDLTEGVVDLVGVKAQYLREHMLSKYSDPSPASAAVRREAAIKKFLAVEKRNTNTNHRLFVQDNGENIIAPGRSINSFLEEAARLIIKVIGSEPPVHLIDGSFSGGASTSKKREAGMVERKYTGTQDVSHKAWDHVWPHIIAARLWVDMNPLALQPRFVDHSILFTVPKNNIIDRVACKEPDYNMYMQKGAGHFIRRRLAKRAGIDLNDQTVNQRYAALALAEKLATVDLSSASDTVTTQLVCRLLPVGWFVYLDELRVHKVLIDETLHDLEMFSTMGNGFTFELESLIFWALTRAATNYSDKGGIVSVYGDDIIMPSGVFPLLQRLLSYCGFKVNEDKSFWTGPYRESCGKHYHCGVDITPFYIKGPIITLVDLIHVCNRLRKWAAGNGTWCDSAVFGLWCKLAKHVPRRLWGGYDLDSTATLASYEGDGYRLVERKKVVLLEDGRYLSWQASADLRLGLTESMSSIQEVLTLYDIRRRKLDPRTFGLGAPVFSEELETK